MKETILGRWAASTRETRNDIEALGYTIGCRRRTRSSCSRDERRSILGSTCSFEQCPESRENTQASVPLPLRSLCVNSPTVDFEERDEREALVSCR